ncbi:MAG: DUF4349 domain-containing protein [Ruthenibacterium sp.]
MKRYITLLLTFSLILGLLSGCAGAQKSAMNLSVDSAKQPMSDKMENAPMPTGAASIDGGTMTAALLPKNRKIILNANLTVEALDFAKTRSEILAQIDAMGGYIQSSNQHGKNDGESICSAEIVARIPVQNYAEFLTATEKSGNVTYKQEYTDDVTDVYVDTEARLRALQTEETRLLELMKAAEKVEDLIAIETRLSEVRYETERYTATKRDMDQQIDYSTITVSIEEVKTFTETQDGFGARIWGAVKGSLRGFVAILQNAVIVLIYCLPMLLLALIVFVVLRLILCRRKKRVQQKAAQIAAKDEPESTKPE